VFIEKNLDEKQKLALKYAIEFAKNIHLEKNVIVVEDENEIPDAKCN
jgi:hypothetical protein